MSIGVPGAFDPHNPFASAKGGQYDPSALKGLFLRAQRGDTNARKYLTDLGFFGAGGESAFAPLDVQAGNYDPAITQWAQQTGSTAFAGPSFGWQPSYVSGDPAFASAWDKWFQTGGQGTDFVPPATKTIAPQGPSTSAPTPGANTFGYDYSRAAPGYNAWALYNGGTNDGGWYNATADTQRWDSGRGDGSKSNTRDTIWRWTLDDLRGTPEYQAAGGDASKVPVDVVNKLFLNNVARMHRDFDTNKLNWQQSGFANFDRVLAPAAAAPGQPGTPGGTPQAPPPTTYTNPQTGQTTTAGGGDANQTLRNIALLNNPDQALATALRRLGLDPTRQGLYTSSIANTLSPALQAQMQLNGLYGDRNAIDTAEQTINEFTGTLQRPGGFGALNAQAQGLLSDPRFGGLAGKLGDQQAINLMQTILSQAYAGRNKIYNQARLNQFNAAYGPGGQYAQASLDNLGNPNFPRPVEWLQGSDFADLLNTY